MPFFLSRNGRWNRRSRGGPIQATSSPKQKEDVPPPSPPTSAAVIAGSAGPRCTPISVSLPVHLPGLEGGWDDQAAGDVRSGRMRQTSWSSTSGASEPIDIPHSPREDDFLGGHYQTTLTGGGGFDSAGDSPMALAGLGAADSGSCWAASWYQSEPGNTIRQLGTPEKPPAHIMIWEERTSRSASQALMDATAREAGRRNLVLSPEDAANEELPNREDTTSEDSIFDMDL